MLTNRYPSLQYLLSIIHQYRKLNKNSSMNAHNHCLGMGTNYLNNILLEALVAERILDEEEAPSGAVAKAAFNFFGELDSANTGRLPSDCFESLLELLGEGFCGEELQTQLDQVDPERSGIITKSKFIDWYVKLVEGSSAKEDHSDQSFTDDLERAEELE
jgi:hypothetical protein